MVSYFGLGLDYDDDWVGRYYAQEGNFITVAAMPSAAYRVNDWLSVGGGVGAVYGRFKAKSAVRNLEPGTPDGQLEYKDGAFGVLGSVGVLFEPWENARFGITYYSPVDLGFEDRPVLSGVDPQARDARDAVGVSGSKLKIDFTLPPSTPTTRIPSTWRSVRTTELTSPGSSWRASPTTARPSTRRTARSPCRSTDSSATHSACSTNGTRT